MGESGARYSGEVGRVADEIGARLAPIAEVSWRRMFGGAGLFAGGRMFALVDAEGRPHLKADGAMRERFEAAGGSRHGRMPYCSIPGEVLADDALLQEWAARSIALAQR